MITDLKQLLEADIPFSSFLGKGKDTLEILELCAEENKRRIAREYWTILHGLKTREKAAV